MPCPCTLYHRKNAPCERVEDDVRYWRMTPADVEMLTDAGIVSEPVAPWPVERFDDDD